MQIRQPARIDQLLPACQRLARCGLPTLQLEQLLDPLLAQQTGHLGHFAGRTVEGNRTIGLQSLDLEGLWPLFIAVFPLGREVLGARHMAALLLPFHRPPLIEVAGAGIQDDSLFGLGIGQRERWQLPCHGGQGTPEQ